MFKHVVVKIQ